MNYVWWNGMEWNVSDIPAKHNKLWEKWGFEFGTNSPQKN